EDFGVPWHAGRGRADRQRRLRAAARGDPVGAGDAGRDRRHDLNDSRRTEAKNPDLDEREFDSLLHYLRQQRAFDFSGYKRPSLMRRISKRMQLVGVASFADYVDYLEVHPEEFPQLFN